MCNRNPQRYKNGDSCYMEKRSGSNYRKLRKENKNENST